jgi:hypothetical protein
MTLTKTQKLRKKAASSRPAVAKKKSSKKKKIPSAHDRVRFGPPPSPPKHHSASASASSMKQLPAREAASEVQVAREWMAAMEDPTCNLAPAIGAEQGSQVFVNTGTFDYTLSTPNIGALVLPRGGNGFWVNGTITAAAPGTWNQQAMPGDTALVAHNQGRFLALDVRWWVKHSDTTIPGYVSAGRIPSVLVSTDFTSLTGTQIIATRGFAQFNNKDAYQGRVGWKPIDNADGEFTMYATNSVTTFHSTAVPIIYMSGWAIGTVIRFVCTQQIEVLPYPAAYVGLPLAFQYNSHDWSAVCDYLLALPNHPLVGVIGNLAARHALRVAVGAIAGGAASWWGGSGSIVNELRADGDSPSGIPVPPEGYFSDKYLASPQRVNEEISRLRDELLQLRSGAEPSPKIVRSSPSQLKWEAVVDDPFVPPRGTTSPESHETGPSVLPIRRDSLPKGEWFDVGALDASSLPKGTVFGELGRALIPKGLLSPRSHSHK